MFTGGGDARQYFVNTFINGSCDSIYGLSSAVFDRCTIAITYSVTAHRGASLAGHARTAYLIVNSSLVKPMPGEAAFPAPDGGTVLGRPWGNLSFTVYKNVFMDSHIAPTAWDDWGHSCSSGVDKGADCSSNPKCWCSTVVYAEYESHGPGATAGRLAERVRWSRQLAPKEAASITPVSVLRGWIPQDLA